MSFLKKIESDDFWIKHKLRKPDKKDLCYFLAVFMFFGYSLGTNIKQGDIEEESRKVLSQGLRTQAAYYNGIIEEKDAEIEEKEDLYNSAIGANISSVDFSIMKRSEILNRIEQLEIFIDNFKTFEMTDMPLYASLENHLNECYQVLADGTYLNPYTWEDYNLLAYAIHREAGSSWLLDEHRDLVGMVVINRRNQGGINGDLTNPTIADILNEEGQYPYKSWNYSADVIENYCWESARRCLEGEVECPSNVIWQATFPQGDGVYKTFYSEKSGTTTYFCYSN